MDEMDEIIPGLKAFIYLYSRGGAQQYERDEAGQKGPCAFYNKRIGRSQDAWQCLA